jgi:ElaB/YqjD/DUF883 family membrane-anchored ribosome-binding protein
MSMTEQVATTEAGAGKVDTGKLMEDLKAVVADAEELLKATANQTGERIASARAKAEESLKAAKARLAEEGSGALAKAQSAAKTADDYVRVHPWQAAGIAAAVGFVLAVLAVRR